MKEERQPLQGCLLCQRLHPEIPDLLGKAPFTFISLLGKDEAVFETLRKVSPFTSAGQVEGILELNLGMPV